MLDTFEGFDDRDVKIEKAENLSKAQKGIYSKTSEELVMSRMPFPRNVIINKGFFPETAKDIDDQFCLVNLDMNLYEPTIAGLNLFKDKMVRGGIILVHDYYTNYTGIKKAVDEFVSDNASLTRVPIGDDCSMAVVGF